MVALVIDGHWLHLVELNDQIQLGIGQMKIGVVSCIWRFLNGESAVTVGNSFRFCCKFYEVRL
jgi:hypothetical protein